MATEFCFSVAKWKNLVAKKWFVKFLLHCSYQSPDVGDFHSPKTWRPLNSDYSARILPLFFLFKLFSMKIENFDKTRVKFLVEIKREIFRFNSLDTTLKS